MHTTDAAFWTSTAIAFIGTGTSHFQSEPYRKTDWFPTLDWEVVLAKTLSGQPCGITVPVSREELPSLLEHKEDYVNRSGELGLNMYRLSFDLGRLCPDIDMLDKQLMAKYVRLLALARIAGQEPLVTLQHFTLPWHLVVTDKNGSILKGGWEHPDVVNHFRHAVKKVVESLSSPDFVRMALIEFDSSKVEWLIESGLVKHWMPFNEPGAALGNSYLGGNFPPYKKLRFAKYILAMRKMAEVYKIMVDHLRVLGRHTPTHRAPVIGNGYDWQYFVGPGSSFLHRWANEWYTDLMERNVNSDFVGLHYYGRSPLSFTKDHPDDMGQGDFDAFGPINPAGIGVMLHKIHQRFSNKKVFVSEIGFADADDVRRPYWLILTTEHILKAAKEGVPIRGILYWSLADIFEWQRAMTQKFGLFTEAELAQSLEASDGKVHSWQVWRAIAKQLRSPSPESLAELLALRERAATQYWLHVESKQKLGA